MNATAVEVFSQLMSENWIQIGFAVLQISFLIPTAILLFSDPKPPFKSVSITTMLILVQTFLFGVDKKILPCVLSGFSFVCYTVISIQSAVQLRNNKVEVVRHHDDVYHPIIKEDSPV